MCLGWVGLGGLEEKGLWFSSLRSTAETPMEMLGCAGHVSRWKGEDLKKTLVRRQAGARLSPFDFCESAWRLAYLEHALRVDQVMVARVTNLSALCLGNCFSLLEITTACRRSPRIIRLYLPHRIEACRREA